MYSQWRRFSFFTSAKVTEPTDENQPLEAVKSLNISCCTSGRGKLTFGDNYPLFLFPSFSLFSFF